MKVFLRKPVLGLYFQDLDKWTSDLSRAFDFNQIDDAYELARGTASKDCEIVLFSDASSLSSTAPCPARNDRPD